MKKQTIEIILLIEENNPQRRMKNVDVKGTNCFSVFIVLKCRVIQLFRVMAIEIARTAIGSWIPRKPFCCLNTASKPPVVLVSVVANKSRIICPAT